MNSCLFCRIVDGQESASLLFQDEVVVAILDIRPVFFGHVLLFPRQHIENLESIPPDVLNNLFSRVQILAGVVETALKAQGTFIALNNKVSQSIPHVHIHIIPRSKGDGLRGFFWPRRRYESVEQMENIRKSIHDALQN